MEKETPKKDNSVQNLSTPSKSQNTPRKRKSKVAEKTPAKEINAELSTPKKSDKHEETQNHIEVQQVTPLKTSVQKQESESKPLVTETPKKVSVSITPEAKVKTPLKTPKSSKSNKTLKTPESKRMINEETPKKAESTPKIENATPKKEQKKVSDTPLKTESKLAKLLADAEAKLDDEEEDDEFVPEELSEEDEDIDEEDEDIEIEENLDEVADEKVESENINTSAASNAMDIEPTNSASVSNEAEGGKGKKKQKKDKTQKSLKTEEGQDSEKTPAESNSEQNPKKPDYKIIIFCNIPESWNDATFKRFAQLFGPVTSAKLSDKKAKEGEVRFESYHGALKALLSQDLLSSKGIYARHGHDMVSEKNQIDSFFKKHNGGAKNAATEETEKDLKEKREAKAEKRRAKKEKHLQKMREAENLPGGAKLFITGLPKASNPGSLRKTLEGCNPVNIRKNVKNEEGKNKEEVVVVFSSMEDAKKAQSVLLDGPLKEEIKMELIKNEANEKKESN
ncbi:uncharacterized protein MONOS_2583 [Monocercomonoides exilis]|uniref:uncharacterized protein n=1 Tax=Monocercomonoides exilis TaxID=2049356 RepID=UPI00355A035E|nr:hypothetical protein MONOS_2583 [Monocercomonoides exilis]|eukprot:MONOS_2583.1-p1 / transcript=MONOS_2583.1 / gene=MONOS_2583 / organism=Monocercomonoides_exilis_PA203 / gene_product=unspecified product / transcript_product=unspecified product / location=Mono_scaffold00054:65140-66826(-) / protein_length=508 / sequence_SO=supercontig / SO=protein_coding / is_pseudo=false